DPATLDGPWSARRAVDRVGEGLNGDSLGPRESQCFQARIDSLLRGERDDVLGSTATLGHELDRERFDIDLVDGPSRRFRDVDRSRRAVGRSRKWQGAHRIVRIDMGLVEGRWLKRIQ